MNRGSSRRLRDTLLTHGDHYMHLADLKSYLEADQRLLDCMPNPDAWARKAILNVAGSGNSPATAPSPNTRPRSGR